MSNITNQPLTTTAKSEVEVGGISTKNQMADFYLTQCPWLSQEEAQSKAEHMYNWLSTMYKLTQDQDDLETKSGFEKVGDRSISLISN